MEKPSYNIQSTVDGCYHTFESSGNKGIIQKAITFVPTDDENLYHLIFGNLKSNGDIDVFAVSNNEDMNKIISTVVVAVIAFFEKNKSKSIVFTGSTPSRTRLYRAVIAKLIPTVQEKYVVKGISELGKVELFNSSKTYIGYLITYK